MYTFISTVDTYGTKLSLRDNPQGMLWTVKPVINDERQVSPARTISASILINYVHETKGVLNHYHSLSHNCDIDRGLADNTLLFSEVKDLLNLNKATVIIIM